MNFIRENVPLAELTTLKIGGKARFFAAAKSETEVIEALKFAEDNKLEIFILGGGSNVLIADEGFNGLVLQIALRGISVAREENQALVTARAGENWDAFCAFCVAENLQGVECLSGIPGLIGGTPVQNVGAYGQEVSETIASVRAFDRKEKNITKLTNAECGFGYRTSVFNTTERDRYVVLAVKFALKYNGDAKIAYRDLQNYFGDRKPTLPETRRAILEIRAAKSMVIDARDINSRSAGSFFKNPVVSSIKFAEIEERAKMLGIVSVPYFKVDEENVKIPAAWLIETSGFQKGYRRKTVGISTKHTLAIVNLGNATAHDVLELKDEIQTEIEKNFGVLLTPEPVFVGFGKKLNAEIFDRSIKGFKLLL